ncbi:MAG: exosortase/archaeosortase family protein [Candidatus Aminicenantales bacterium]
MRKKDWLFALLTAVTLALAVPPLVDLLRTRWLSEYYGHISLIPIVSAYLMFRRRREIFRGTASGHPWGILAAAAGVGLYVAGRFLGGGFDVRASLTTLGALLFWCGSYLLLYGKNGSRRAFFPLAFLLFAVPIPAPIIEKIIAVLVVGSAYMTRLLLVGLGVPFVQEGPVFRLPGFAIEIAQECSGIRSSLALLITTVLAGQIFLKKFWKQALLALAVFPVALFKNAIRIVTLYLLSYFVDMRIIKGGFLHRSGGFIFFGLGLVVLASILWLLREGEGRRSGAKMDLGDFKGKKIN